MLNRLLMPIFELTLPFHVSLSLSSFKLRPRLLDLGSDRSVYMFLLPSGFYFSISLSPLYLLVFWMFFSLLTFVGSNPLYWLPKIMSLAVRSMSNDSFYKDKSFFPLFFLFVSSHYTVLLPMFLLDA